MSPAEHFVRHNRLQTDCAISQAYARLVADSHVRAMFTSLLHGVRQRSDSILLAPVVDDHHCGVEALFNLSRFAEVHVRSVTSWTGSSASWRGAIASLAQHLLGRYRVPAFLGAAWYATDMPNSETKRSWYVAHAAGVRFRSLALPIRMTRKMEDIFLRSRDHLSIEQAMRRAELMAMGAPDTLVDAVLGTSRGSDLTNGEFWRSVGVFLIANVDAVGLAQVGPIIDFLQSIRHERIAVESADGTVMQEPPQPRFSMKGRTARSVLRMMEDWHRGLGLETGGLSWERSHLKPMIVEVPRQEPTMTPLVWEITELTNSAQLRAEGVALRHCVGSYSNQCWRGATRIWSLRARRESTVRPIVTIEVDPRRRAIVQARGFRNRLPSGNARRLLERWAAREQLRFTM